MDNHLLFAKTLSSLDQIERDDNQRLKPGPSKIVETSTRGSGVGLSLKFGLCPSSRALILPRCCRLFALFGGSGFKSLSKIDDCGS
ncbi:conserved hypothetical protein [Ricinus communis]|uniref:Uncharacterized protein n=1 Tax=Ricinus communis TaxID=3988 RepID=B9T8X9_RICCO|nr:conserved hypothetical protein [Ricinus communis]